MRCANMDAANAAAQVRAAGEQASQDTAACDALPADDDEQPATPDVAGARGHPRAVSPSAGSAEGGSSMDVDPVLEVIYLGETDAASDSQSPSRSSGEADDAESRANQRCGSLDPELRHELFGSSEESNGSSRGSSRAHTQSVDASEYDDASHCDDVNDYSRSHCSRSNRSDCGDRSVHRDTTQE